MELCYSRQFLSLKMSRRAYLRQGVGVSNATVGDNSVTRADSGEGVDGLGGEDDGVVVRGLGTSCESENSDD